VFEQMDLAGPLDAHVETTTTIQVCMLVKDETDEFLLPVIEVTVAIWMRSVQRWIWRKHICSQKQKNLFEID
jgi:hypothetical protein